MKEFADRLISCRGHIMLQGRTTTRMVILQKDPVRYLRQCHLVGLLLPSIDPCHEITGLSFWCMTARLAMLVRVSGCSSPRTRFLVSITKTSSTSASFHLPWFQYVDARLAMLLRVLGCSSPRTRFLISITETSSTSASFHLPWFQYVNARLP